MKSPPILFDDTVYQRRGFHGKGARAVPWLLDHGWKILYSGHQTLLGRWSGREPPRGS